MLTIKNLSASINGKEILKGVNLEVNAGEVNTPSWDQMEPERVLYPMLLPGGKVMK